MWVGGGPPGGPAVTAGTAWRCPPDAPHCSHPQAVRIQVVLLHVHMVHPARSPAPLQCEATGWRGRCRVRPTPWTSSCPAPGRRAANAEGHAPAIPVGALSMAATMNAVAAGAPLTAGTMSGQVVTGAMTATGCVTSTLLPLHPMPSSMFKYPAYRVCFTGSLSSHESTDTGRKVEFVMQRGPYVL